MLSTQGTEYVTTFLGCPWFTTLVSRNPRRGGQSNALSASAVGRAGGICFHRFSGAWTSPRHQFIEINDRIDSAFVLVHVPETGEHVAVTHRTDERALVQPEAPMIVNGVNVVPRTHSAPRHACDSRSATPA